MATLITYHVNANYEMHAVKSSIDVGEDRLPKSDISAKGSTDGLKSLAFRLYYQRLDNDL